MNNTLVTLTLVLLLDGGEQPDLLLQRSSNPTARSEKTAPILPAPPTTVPPDVIPKASIAMPGEEGKWWEDVRAAGRNAYLVWRARAEAFENAFNKVSPYVSLDTVLPKAERERLNSRLMLAKTQLLEALTLGMLKGYRPPFDDQMPLRLNKPMPSFTETARKNHTQGLVQMNVEFGADGLIRILKVTKSLPDGLEGRAKEAVRDILFLPAVKDRGFISYQEEIKIEFHLRD